MDNTNKNINKNSNTNENKKINNKRGSEYKEQLEKLKDKNYIKELEKQGIKVVSVNDRDCLIIIDRNIYFIKEDCLTGTSL